jgi:hypothetical protein
MKDRLKNCLENLLTVSNNRGGESALKRIRGRNTHGQAIRSLVIPSHWIFSQSSVLISSHQSENRRYRS